MKVLLANYVNNILDKFLLALQPPHSSVTGSAMHNPRKWTRNNFILDAVKTAVCMASKSRNVYSVHCTHKNYIQFDMIWYALCWMEWNANHSLHPHIGSARRITTFNWKLAKMDNSGYIQTSSSFQCFMGIKHRIYSSKSTNMLANLSSQCITGCGIELSLSRMDASCVESYHILCMYTEDIKQMHQSKSPATALILLT